MDLRLDGKRVVLTAGAAGIGRVTLQTFVDAGARVVTCDVDQAGIDRLRGELPTVPGIVADVALADDVDRLFDLAEQQLGGLDILINNAGIAGPTAPIEAVEPDDWRRTLEVNVTGQYLCARRAVPLLKAAGGGSIVNLSSAAGRFGFALRTPYCASKWAVVGLSKALAIELGPDQIRVNAICPGAVEGDRINRVIAAKAKARGMTFEAMYEEYTADRLDAPDDQPAGHRQHDPLPVLGCRPAGLGPDHRRRRQHRISALAAGVAMPRPDPANVERVAVLGAGTIGASWTALFLARGLAVAVYDPAPDTEARVRAFIERAWPTLGAAGASGERRSDPLHAPQGAGRGGRGRRVRAGERPGGSRRQAGPVRARSSRRSTRRRSWPRAPPA